MKYGVRSSTHFNDIYTFLLKQSYAYYIRHKTLGCYKMCVTKQSRWAIETLRAVDYLLPQTRIRVFLKGIRKCLCETMPAALSPFGPRHLREVLGKFPNQVRACLNSNLQRNLRHAEFKIKNLVRLGKVKLQDLVVVPIDRAPDKVYKQNHTVNLAPTLTTHNVCLPDGGPDAGGQGTLGVGAGGPAV